MNAYATLAWFPKPFGPGDMDGSGEKKVLGRPEVDFINLLVRESAQNSWDAKVHGVVPRFELRLRRIEGSALALLRRNVFAQRLSASALDMALEADSLSALEIVDRGTKGLGGPTQNSISRDDEEPNDYADFILTVGAPPEDLLGGGSYGFGKTASYLASRCSTIVVWSRALTKDGDFVERFVASAMGGVFEQDGQRFTGRQWWGARPQERQPHAVLAFEPIEGIGARRLGEAIFARHFGPEETGTSILVLDFTPSGQLAELDEDLGPAEVANRLADAVVRNLWTKLAVDQADQWRMDASVSLDGAEIPLSSPRDSPVLEGLWRCLRAIRAVQSGEAQVDEGIEVRPTRRYSDITGHIALTNVITDPELDPLSGLEDRVTLMRHRAELVVRADPYPGRLAESLRWVGLFKPVLRFDEAFAASEPPAHDSWAHVEGLDKRTKSIVSVSLREVRNEVRTFLTPADFAIGAETQSTGALSSALAGLTGAVAGSGASIPRRPRRRQGGAPQTRPSVDLRAIEPLARDRGDLERGRQRTKITVALGGDRSSVLRLEGLAVAVDGGTMNLAGEVTLDHWIGGSPVGDGVLAPPGDEVSAIVSYPAGVAISFSVKAGDS